MVLSTICIPIFSIINLLLSSVCLYALISNLFKWKNYDYLFVMYSLVGASLSMIISYCKIRFDCVIIFSIEIYKFFLLIIGTIIFGIIAV